MERHRCTHCRNPIRHGGDVLAPSSDNQESWFHPDCWEVVLSAKQKDYQFEVKTRGLEALLAPYISPAHGGGKFGALVLLQGNAVEPLT